MSVNFDRLSAIWAKHIRPVLEAEGKENLAYRFERVLEELHEANHRAGDVINKDPAVHKAVNRLLEEAPE